MIITIDGTAGTGKSTVAQGVAKRLGIAYFDTGALYRSFAWYSEKCKAALHEAATTFSIEITDDKRYLVDGKDISHEIRTPEITALSSEVSRHAFVREAMNVIQKRYAKEHDAVFEGRDIGSVVFPDAQYKFFLTAKVEVRAERRFKEMQEKGMDGTYDQVLADILARDHADSTRDVAPLKEPKGAHVIDTSTLTIDEVIGVICREIEK